MATTITKSNLFSEARNNIKDLISANVTDPTTPSSQFRKWVYAREPDIKSAGFKGYPFIIINASELDISRDGRTLDLKSNMINWTLEIEVVSSDRGNGNQSGKGLDYMDTISDSIMEVLYNKTNLNTLNTNLIHNLNVSASSVGTEALADELVYRRSFIIDMQTKIQTSA